MARLLVHVEGSTEERFVNEILEPHLCRLGFERVDARLLGKPRLRAGRGGIRAWSSVRKEIVNRLREDRACLATTMVDYYGLPQHGAKAWPGRANGVGADVAQKARWVESALAEEIRTELGDDLGRCRFVPFVTMHEFEGLLFSDCEAFGHGIGRPDLVSEFQSIRDRFPTPEDINDSVTTAPSKRVRNLVPGYQKPLLGTIAVQRIGLAAIRSECPHFRAWLEQLEALPR